VRTFEPGVSLSLLERRRLVFAAALLGVGVELTTMPLFACLDRGSCHCTKLQTCGPNVGNAHQRLEPMV
jgi:hypothetical protein